MANVRVSIIGAGCILAVCSLPSLVGAAPGSGWPATADQADLLRSQISKMEGLLERAVQDGARQTSQKLQAVVPEPLLWNGTARARGYHLADYGLFFAVDIPMLSGSVIMSIQLLDQGMDRDRLEGVFQALHSKVQQLTDRSSRDQMDQTLRILEAQVLGVPAQAPGGEARPVAMARPAAPPPNPNDMYTTDVKNALVEAMLDYGDKLQVPPDEWLTVAARDAGSNRVGAGQLDDLTTMTLRIRGSDLAALGAGRLTREEARKRVEVREF
jgi:hypothetical protein